MDAAWSRMITETQASGRQAVLAITGGGTGAIAELLRVPGGSRLLLEAVIPYDPRSLAEFLGAVPEQACSGETAVAMAERARQRAAAIARAEAAPIGLGATASLVSDRPKQGDHRCHIAVATDAGTDLIPIVLDKGRRVAAHQTCISNFPHPGQARIGPHRGTVQSSRPSARRGGERDAGQDYPESRAKAAGVRLRGRPVRVSSRVNSVRSRAARACSMAARCGCSRSRLR